jgi:hypothetical protein
MKKTADDFLMKYGIPSDTTIGIEGDHKLTDLLEEYRSQASDLPSDEEIEKEFRTDHEFEDDINRSNLQCQIGAIWMKELASPLLASHVARILELEEDLRRSNIREKSFSDFRREVLEIDNSRISIIDDKYFPF